MDKKDLKFEGFLNPLRFFEAEFPPGEKEPLPTPEQCLRFLCTPGVPSGPRSLAERYKEVTGLDVELHVAPIEEALFQKLVWPLRHAKGCHMVGNYLGTIALCGMVAEMTAILLFEINETKVDGNPITEEQQKHLFGSTFERLPQHRRVAVLQGKGVVDESMTEHFETIRLTRRRYLHYWSQVHKDLASDSVAAYGAALNLVVRAVGQDFRDGQILLNPALVPYLMKQEAKKMKKEGE